MSRGLDHGHFNAVATEYRACRPSYPDALFEWIAAKAPNHDLCWDVGCGNDARSQLCVLEGQFPGDFGQARAWRRSFAR